MPRVDLTPVQHKMMQMLSDGRAHSDKELHSCLTDDLAPLKAIRYHLTFVRNYLQEKQQVLITERKNGTLYYYIARVVRINNE